MRDLDELRLHQFHDAVPDLTHLFPQNFVSHDLITNKYIKTKISPMPLYAMENFVAVYK